MSKNIEDIVLSQKLVKSDRYPKLKLVLGGSVRYIPINRLSNYLLLKIIRERSYLSTGNTRRCWNKSITNRIMPFLVKAAMHRKWYKKAQPIEKKTKILGISL